MKVDLQDFRTPTFTQHNYLIYVLFGSEIIARRSQHNVMACVTYKSGISSYMAFWIVHQNYRAIYYIVHIRKSM